MEIRKILLCTDGEEQTARAEDFAISVAKGTRALVCALYVVNPFLKKFADEIYAVGREQYRDFIDEALRTEGTRALEQFRQKACKEKVEAVLKMRYGNPEEEILQEMDEERYDLAVVGSKLPGDWRARLQSCNLQEKVFRKANYPIAFVR